MIRFDKSHDTMPLIVILSAWVFIQMGISLFHQLRDVQFSNHLFGYIGDYLLDMLNKHSVFEMLFTLLLCFTVYRMLDSVIKHSYLAYKWNVYLKSRIHIKLTKKWNNRLKSWDEPVLVIREHSPVALASGFLHPKIIVSTGLLHILSPEEVKAVLLHEKYHCLRRHPFKKWLVRLLINSMRYISVIKSLGAHYEIWIELQADRYVMKRMNPLTLGAALLKLIKVYKHDNQTVGVSFAEQAINYRLQQIIEPDQPVVSILPLSTIVSTCAVLTGMLMIVVFGCV